MEQKINIAELLKYCPKGMELYSPLCGKCVFDRLNFGTIICKKQNTQEITFTSKGYYMLPVFDDCECMIFPSKDQRDWSKFESPCKFMDGDVVATTEGLWIGITIGGEKGKFIPTYCVIQYGGKFEAYLDRKESWVFNRLATEEEKAKLFQVIKDNGYNWNPETKTLEKLAEPKFKVGDIIQDITGICKVKITEVNVEDKCYLYKSLNINGIGSITFNRQDDWELVQNKFDISTLKPFDKVLVRDNNTQKWTADLFSFYDKSLVYPYSCVGHYTNQCVPYEENQQLLGTTDDCDEFYKNW